MVNLERAATQFRRAYGQDPRWAAYAPGRVNLIGEHVDYHGGPVFPLAIDRGVTIVAGPSTGATHAVSEGYRKGASFRVGKLDQHRPVASWSKYLAGAAWSVGARSDLVMSVVSDLPTGTGLSSSAAIEVAAALVWNLVDDLGISQLDVARAAQRAENDYVGMPCGIMDQTASAMGRAGSAMVIDTATLAIAYTPLPEEVAVVVCETGVRHSLGDSGYPDRRRASEEAARQLGVPMLDTARFDDVERLEDPVLRRRARHVVTEIARVPAFALALESRKRQDVFDLMKASHVSLRDDYEVSCEELDVMAESCWEHPATWGARMTGGGFGGACVALVEKDKCDDFVSFVEQSYSRRVKGTRSTFTTCQASAGASAWQL